MASKKKKAPAPNVPTKTQGKRAYFKQADFPFTSLQQAQRVASAIIDKFGGREVSPPDVALSINVSPTSSAWPTLAGSAIAYGITEGGVNASSISITPLGRRLVSPEEEGEDVAARREAILRPRLMKDFYEKYRRAKFPNHTIAANVLKAMGIAADRVDTAIEVVTANGYYAGVIRDTPTGPFVNLDSPGIPGPVSTPATQEVKESSTLLADIEPVQSGTVGTALSQAAVATIDPKINKVFITHGKQKAIVNQIKELLVFGNFDPVVSVERESTAIPVPEKVFEDMRSCAAGVIHVGAEGKYRDPAGGEHTKINDNVLIEIGAAMALYGKKVILLVEKGVVLPSNLQGLYRCEFEGDQLNYEATMKLLKTFSQFR